MDLTGVLRRLLGPRPGDLVETYTGGRARSGVVVHRTWRRVLWAPLAASGVKVRCETGPDVYARTSLRILDERAATRVVGRANVQDLRPLQDLPRPKPLDYKSIIPAGSVVTWRGGTSTRAVVLEDDGTDVTLSPLHPTISSIPAHLRGSAVALTNPATIGGQVGDVAVTRPNAAPRTSVEVLVGHLDPFDHQLIHQAAGGGDTLPAGSVVTSDDGHYLVLANRFLPRSVLVQPRVGDADENTVGGWELVGVVTATYPHGKLVDTVDVPEGLTARLGEPILNHKDLHAGGIYWRSGQHTTSKVLLLDRGPGQSTYRGVTLPLALDATTNSDLVEFLQGNPTIERMPYKVGDWAHADDVDLAALSTADLPEAYLAAFNRPHPTPITAETILQRGTVALVRSGNGYRTVTVWEETAQGVEVMETTTVRRNLPPDVYRIERHSAVGSIDPLGVTTHPILIAREDLTKHVGTLDPKDTAGWEELVAKDIVLPVLEETLPRGAIVTATFFNKQTRSESIGTYIVWGDLDDVRDDAFDCVNAVILREHRRDEHHQLTQSPLSGHDGEMWAWPHPIRISRQNLLRVQGVLSDEDVQSLEEAITERLVQMVVPGRILWAPVEFKGGNQGKIRPLVIVAVDGEKATALALSASTHSPLSDMRSYTLVDWRGAELGKGGRVTDTRVTLDIRKDSYLLGRYLSNRDLKGVLALVQRTQLRPPTGRMPRRNP